MRSCLLYLIFIFVIIGCNDDINVFDQTADERGAEAIQNLKNDLIAPSNGWKVLYQPSSSSGSFYAVMNFNEDNTVRIQTDLGAENGRFFDDTLTYRIDNSLNVELIFESYSFFSFLFELDQAVFPAEFEFLYANKTEANELVFTSKTDGLDQTVLVFVPAAADEASEILGTSLSLKINELADDLNKVTPSLKLSYNNRDLALYIALDNAKRTIDITSATKKSSTASPDIIEFSSGYVIKKDSIIFDERLEGTFQGTTISISGLHINELVDLTTIVCAIEEPINGLTGTTSEGDAFTIESTLLDPKGALFANASDFFACPPQNMIQNGESAYTKVVEDIDGVIAMQLYYNYDGDGFYALGFVLENSDGSVYFALREFTPTIVENNFQINWTGDLTIYNDVSPPEADLNKINEYLDAFSANNGTYVYRFSESLFEFYNPCTKWSFLFISINS